MYTVNFNKTSWHAKLFNKILGYDAVEYETNICSYTREWLKIVMGAAFVCTFIGGIATCIVNFLVAVIVGLIQGVWLELTFPGQFGMLLIFIMILVSIIFCICAFLSQFYSKVAQKCSTEHSFIVESYRAYKNKFCVKINWVENGSKKV